MDFKTIESETEYGNVSVVPKPPQGLPEFTKEQFLDGTAINALFEAFGKSPIALETEKIRMKPQNISNILSRGTCLPVTAARIADGLGVAVTDIMEVD